MTIPLVALALLSLGGGYFNVPRWLEPLFPLAEEGHNAVLVYISVAAGLAGIGLAWLFYVVRPGLADRLADLLGWIYTLVYNKYFVDEVYNAAVIEPCIQGSSSVLWRGEDVGLIDGTVNQVGVKARGVGSVLRLLQSGNIRSYAGWVIWGAVLAILAFVLAGGAR
jgi:NADH-quinone oxidoreductase subunit L